jgi:outer membrane protein assembly factor BamB
MSLTQEQFSTAPGRPAAFSWWRSIRFPLLVLVLFGGLFAVPWICVAFHVDTDAIIQLSMFSQWFGPLLALLLLGAWWLFFSPVPRVTRLGVPLGLAFLAGAGFWFLVRDIELTKGRVCLVPLVHFIWEPTYVEQESADPKELASVYGYISEKDFPRYRGVGGNGIVAWAKLDTDWIKTPPTVEWDHPCGGGYSGIAVAGNIVVTLEQRADGESVVCYDRISGKQRWAAASKDVSYKDAWHMGDGPRSTPTIDNPHDPRIYTIGATGELTCHTIDGKLEWRANILEDAQAKNIKWGLTGSPLIVDDLVIAHAGIDENAPADSALIAYEKTKGTIRWRTGNRAAGYSSPQLATLAGIPQILVFDAAGLVSYEPKTGKELWQFPWVTDFAMNSIQPVVLGKDRVFISSELKNGCAMLRVKPDTLSSILPTNLRWSVEVVWQNKNLAARYANPVTDGKSIFGLHNLQGVLTCLDANTGEVKWKGEREGPGQLLLAENALIVVNGDRGEVALFDPDGSACTELARYPAFEKRAKTWNTPALAGDQLFVRNQAHIVCLKLP